MSSIGKQKTKRSSLSIRLLRGKLGRLIFSQRLLGLLLEPGTKTDQWLTFVFPVTIPETIAGHISAPVPFSFIKWWRVLYATSKFPIAPYLPPKFYISIVFNFSWDGCNTQEKWKTKVMQTFGEQIKCMMGNVKVAHKYGPKFDKTFTHAIYKGSHCFRVWKQ